MAKSVLKVLRKEGKVKKKWIKVRGKKIQIEKWERKKEVLLIKVDGSSGFVMKSPGTMEVRGK